MAVNALRKEANQRTDGEQKGKRQQDERRVLFKQRVGCVEAAIQNVQQRGGEARRVEREQHAWRGCERASPNKDSPVSVVFARLG